MAGCTLHMHHVVCDLLTTANGEARASWTLPNTVAIAGARFRHQMVALQYTPGFTIVSAVAADAAELTVGAF